MRLKLQSVIALGISTVIFSGCTSSGGGFLNLGIGDALRKSNICAFKNKIKYTKTPIGNTGLSLPTFGNSPVVASAPIQVDSYVTQQPDPMITQNTMSSPASDCGCNSDAGTIVSTERFFMPQPNQVGSASTEQPSSEIIVPPVVTAPAMMALPTKAPTAKELPKVNPLPMEDSSLEIGPEKTNNFDNLDTEGTLEPLGQLETEDVYEFDSPEEIADERHGMDQSIFEEAELTKRTKFRFDSERNSTQASPAAADQKSKMLTLHARPAQSHNVFKQGAMKPTTQKTVQASHKPYYRQQNALRQQPAPLDDRSYRQARNTQQQIKFKPLPPVSQTAPAQVLTPKTKLVPLPKSKTNLDIKSDATNNSTRTAESTNNQTVNAAPRIPILRATTVSSASILSLKNLANVIDEKRAQKDFYETNRHTAQDTTAPSVEQR